MAEVLQEFLLNSQTALDAFVRHAEADQPRPDGKAVANMTKQVAGDAAKVGVFLDGAAEVKDADLVELVQANERSTLTLLYTLHTCTSARCDALRCDLQALSSALVAAVSSLLTALVRGDRSSTDFKRLIGQVWQACDALKKAPLDAATALFRRTGRALRGVKDTLREVSELLEEAAAVGEGSGVEEPTAAVGEDGDSGKDSDDDLGFSGGEMSAGEVQAATLGRDLLQAAHDALQAVSKKLLEGGAVLDAPEALQRWEALTTEGSGRLRTRAEELGAALFPPQDAAQVVVAAQALAASLATLRDMAQEVHGLGPITEASQRQAASALTQLQQKCS